MGFENMGAVVVVRFSRIRNPIVHRCRILRQNHQGPQVSYIPRDPDWLPGSAWKRATCSSNLGGCAIWVVFAGFAENSDSRNCVPVDIGTIEILSNCQSIQ